jgi:guanylate kinase
VRERVRELEVSISVTTRKPRPDERDHVHYHFVSDEEFDRMDAAGELLEWAEIFGHRSGTPAEPVLRALRAGTDVLLELDVQGAEQVRAKMPDAVLILLEPPTRDELERRLRSRGTEDEDGLAGRLAKADWELSRRSLFEHEVVNDQVERAAGEVAAIIEASRQADGVPKEPEGPANP